MSQGKRLEFRTRRRVTPLYAVLCLLAVALCLFITTTSDFGFMVGLLGAVFFGMCVAMAVRQMLRRGPVVIIDDRGIEDRLTGYGLIPWAEVHGIGLVDLGKGKFLSVQVDHAGSYLQRLSLFQRLLARANALFPGVEPVMINFSLLTPDVGVAVVEITARLRAMPLRPIARCPSCGYDLRETPDRCPECGRAVREDAARDDWDR